VAVKYYSYTSAPRPKKKKTPPITNLKHTSESSRGSSASTEKPELLSLSQIWLNR